MNVILFIVSLLVGAVIAEDVKLEIKLGNGTAEILKGVFANFDSLDGREQVATVNGLVDVVMKEIQRLMITHGFDPMKLPDIHKAFKSRPIIITYHGEMDLKKGWLKNTSTLYRGGNVTVNYTNRILKIAVPLSFRTLLFNYDYSIKFMNLGPTGRIDGSAKDIRVTTAIKMDFNNHNITLENFKIKKTGDINLKFHGNVITDWIANIASGVITTIFKNLINGIIETIVTKTLRDVFEIINGILGVVEP